MNPERIRGLRFDRTDQQLERFNRWRSLDDSLGGPRCTITHTF